MRFRPVYLWFVLPMALVAVWVFMVYLPLSEKTKTKEAELTSLKREVEGIEGRIVVAAETKKRDEQIRMTAEQLQARIPALSSLPGFIKGVMKSAGQDGIIVAQMKGKFQSLDTDKQSPVLRPVFEMNARGNFVQLGRYLEHLQAGEAFRQIFKAHISYDEKSYPALNAAVTIEFKVWRENLLENK